MEIGDIVWRHDYGVGRIHDGGGKGPDCHYWLCFKGSLTLVHSVSLCKLIERRRNENR